MPTKKLLITTFVIILTFLVFLSIKTFFIIRPFFPFFDYLLGQNRPINYLFLLGNDTEIRANGGFAGSYTKVTLSPKNTNEYHPFSFFPIHFNLEATFHDIYVPNGQLNGYVAPPEPVQQAFGHGTWELANADFEPDFPTSATSIRWFLEKGNEINSDILGIINLTTIKNILNIIGDLRVPEYQVSLSPDNLYLFLQGKAETNFFPGSTQKADALHNVGIALIKKLSTLSLSNKIKIAKIILSDLNHQNIVLNSTDPNFQKLLEQKKWDGKYQKPNTPDFFGLIELNLGANKANAYITRQTNHQIFTESDQVQHNIQINFHNSSPESNPNPPLQYGGNYLGYFRLYLPSNATNIEVSHSQIATETANINPEILSHQTPQVTSCSLTLSPCSLYSFWHLTLHGQNSTIDIKYSLPQLNKQNYALTLLKQNGLRSSPQVVNFFDQKFTTDLKKTSTFP